MSNLAYDIGAALGMMKSGSVERVERENTKLLKIAKLLQSKGKLTKAAFKWPWEAFSDSRSFDPKNPEHMKNMRSEVGTRGATIGGAGQYEGSPRAEQAAKLKAYAASGNKDVLTGKVPLPGDKSKVISLNDSDGGDEKGVLSLDSDGGDENGVLSLDSGGGSAAQGGQATHRRNIQLYGVDAANRMKAGGRQPRGGPSKEEQGFWGGPKFGDMQRFWLQMLGQTPSQMRGQDVAREAGYGRALQHKKNLDFIRSTLMGPQIGHYGMG